MKLGRVGNVKQRNKTVGKGVVTSFCGICGEGWSLKKHKLEVKRSDLHIGKIYIWKGGLEDSY